MFLLLVLFSRLKSVSASSGPLNLEEKALFSVGEEVAFKDDGSPQASSPSSLLTSRFFSPSSNGAGASREGGAAGAEVFRYGRVVRWVELGLFLVEDSPSTTRRVQTKHLFKLQSQREMATRASAAAAAAEQASVAAAATSSSSASSSSDGGVGGGSGGGGHPLDNPETAAALSMLPAAERDELLKAGGGGGGGDDDGDGSSGGENVNRVR